MSATGLTEPYTRGVHHWAGVDLERNVEMAARDGTVLRADVYRPARPEGPIPVLLHRTPYGKDFVHDGHYLHPAWYVRNGFMVVVQDIRGRYTSDGEFVPYLQDLEDGYDSVEWAAGLEGANGRVGMYGASYPGMVQYLAAVEAPPSLGAISPTVAAADLHSHWTYEGGALRLFVPHWTAALLMDVGRRRGNPELTAAGKAIRAVSGHAAAWLGSAAPVELEPLGEAEFYLEWLEHPEKDEFWLERSAFHRLAEVQCAVLHIGAWFDTFLEGAVAAYREIVQRDGGPEQWLILGPWGHLPGGEQIGELVTGVEARGTVNLDRVQVDFFHRHLDDPDGAAPPKEDRVRYFEMFANRWHDEDSWPPEGTTTKLYLSSGGSANTVGGDGALVAEAPAGDQPGDVYNFVPRIPVAALGGHTCCDAAALPSGPKDQQFLERLPDILVYSSEPFEEAATIAGPVRAELWTGTDAVSADYVTRLCVVQGGRSINISDGVRRMSAADLDAERDDEGVARVVVEMQSAAARVDKGGRLRLHVTSGAFPAFDINPQTGAEPAKTSVYDGVAAMHAILHSQDRPSSLTFNVLGE